MRAVEGERTRMLILDATEALMREEGYAAVSSRRVAERAGIKSPLVHYHYRTMDDLFRALFRRAETAFVSRHMAVLSMPAPLEAFWEFARDSGAVDLMSEMVAVANHRPELRDELARATERMRLVQNHIAAQGERGGNNLISTEYPPEVLSFLIVSIGRALTWERALGVTTGHSEIIRFVDNLLTKAAG